MVKTCHEIWIWSELIAFDATAPDYGVAAYLDRMGGSRPDGISLLSALDLVMQHDGMDSEKELPPHVCARAGHTRNLFRKRQVWSNYKLRGLVAELRKAGSKVYFSVFTYYLNNHFQHEYLSEHPELNKNGSFLWILDDGRRLGEAFLEKLPQVISDYGFSGWHAPDGNGPRGTIDKANWQDHFIDDFLEQSGTVLPESLREPAGSDHARGLARVAWLWQNCQSLWITHHVKLWNDFFARAIATLHQLGAGVMLNSPDTKSIFEAQYYFGFDYRAIAKLGLDYLVSESSSIATYLIWRESEKRDDFLTEFSMVMQEMRLAMPGVKTLMMPAVQDVVESFDVIRHAPAQFERDFFIQAAQHVLSANGQSLERSASGLMVCLGDSLSAADWEFILDIRERALAFHPQSGGEVLWALADTVFDRLPESHRLTGAWSPYHQVARLVSVGGLDISVAGHFDDALQRAEPLLLTNYDLLDECERRRLHERAGITLIIGNFADFPPPNDRPGVLCQVRDNLKMGAFVLGSSTSNSAVREIPFSTETSAFDNAHFGNSYRDLAPQANIPGSFWSAAGELMRAALASTPLANQEAGLQCRRQSNSGCTRVMISSRKDYYLKPDYRMTAAAGQCLTTVTRFPCADLTVKNGQLACDEFYGSPLHVPPKGILVFEITETGKS